VRTWAAVLLIVIAVPLFVIACMSDAFYALLTGPTPAITSSERYLLYSVSVVNGIVFGLAQEPVKPILLYHLSGKGAKPEPQPLNLWILFVLSFVVSLTFGAFATVAPQA
jgi:hypothetical protein